MDFENYHDHNLPEEEEPEKLETRSELADLAEI